MPAPDAAQDHYTERKKLAVAAAAHALAQWDKVDRDDIGRSWLGMLPEMAAVMSAAQLASAESADPYIDAVAPSSSVDALVSAAAFAGVAADGRSLASLLFRPVLLVLRALGFGASVERAMAVGAANLDMVVRSEVADAGRVADQVAITARPEIDGYIRVVVGDSCSRCIILAGRWYRYSEGFARHPRCDCAMLPAAQAEAANLVQDPMAIYESMTERERTEAGWSEADQKAIDAGADINLVTNARRSVYTAGGREFTRDSTTRRGVTRGRLRARMTPDQIFIEADDDRDEAIRLLQKHGYLSGTPTDRRHDDPAAAAAAADPALKMTIAQLRQAGKDAGAGVLLAGVTRKADILRVLRDWESTRKVKIAGLPEWKPPREVVQPGPEIVAPALGVPSEKGKVLTGASLNDWADYFKYDLQYGRHEFVNANGDTPAEGVRVRDLRTTTSSGGYTVAHGTAWRFNGVAYLVEHGEHDFGSPWVSQTITDLRKAHDTIPAAHTANKSYAVVTGANPDDAYWREKYNNPNHVSAMTAGQGHIYIWNTRAPYGRVWVDGLRHETGHNLDDMIKRGVRGSQSAEWTAAAAADVRSAARIKDLSDRGQEMAKVETARGYPNGVTRYGRSSSAEDFAESVMLYQLGEIATGRLKPAADVGPLYFRDIYPARAKILDTLFPEIAKEQIAALKALRSAKAVKPEVTTGIDLPKLTVPKLKALAKERGLKGYSKLTKPQLLALLR